MWFSKNVCPDNVSPNMVILLSIWFTIKFSLAKISVRRYHWQLGDIASSIRYGRKETSSSGKGVAFSDIVTISRPCWPADFPRRLHKMAETHLFTWQNWWVLHKTSPSKLGCQVQALEWVTIDNSVVKTISAISKLRGSTGVIRYLKEMCLFH